MKKILVGIDFTEADQVLLDTIQSMSLTGEFSVTLLHTIPPMSQWIGCYFAFVPQDIINRKEEAEQFRTKLKAMEETLTAAGLTVDSDLIEAHPGPGIVDYAKEKGYSKIIIGTHSKNLIERALLGSSADHVVRKSTIPVLVVPTMS